MSIMDQYSNVLTVIPFSQVLCSDVCFKSYMLKHTKEGKITLNASLSEEEMKHDGIK